MRVLKRLGARLRREVGCAWCESLAKKQVQRIAQTGAILHRLELRLRPFDAPYVGLHVENRVKEIALGHDAHEALFRLVDNGDALADEVSSDAHRFLERIC